MSDISREEIEEMQNIALKNSYVSPELAREMDKQLFSFTHDQLIKALYWIWDGFDRALINGFAVYETAEAIMNKRQLSGDSIKMGVRDLDWKSGSKSIFDAFTTNPVETNEKYNKYLYEGIPVYVYVYPEDECIRNVNVILYEQENINVPNPYSRFLELYGNSNS